MNCNNDERLGTLGSEKSALSGRLGRNARVLLTALLTRSEPFKKAGLLASAALLASAMLLPSTAKASPQDLFGYGGRTPGMAMTGTSYAEGYEALFANPAGLATVRRRGLVLGLAAAAYRLQLDGERPHLRPATGMTIGFHLPLPFGGFLRDRLVFGGGFFTPSDVLLRGRVYFPEAPQWTVLDRAQVVALQVGMGIDLHGVVDGLSLGFGVSALADIVGQLDVQLDVTQSFSSVIETQLVTTFAPSVGFRYAQPQWGIGVNYRHELAARMSLEIAVRDLPVELPLLTVGGIVQYDPPTLLAEAYYRPIPDLMLVANLTTRFWQAYPGASIPSTVASRQAPAPEFSNILSPRVAIEGHIGNEYLELRIRGGYAYEPSPAPPARMASRRDAGGAVLAGDQVPFRVLDNDRHVLTAGIGWEADVGEELKLKLDVYGQMHILAPREHEVGASEGAPNMRTEGVIFAGGWTLGADFQ